jgi:uncharacterized damage-inducible protein DinB
MSDGFPELRAGERESLEQFLDFHRRGVVEALDEVDDEAAAARVLPATELTIGGIVKHLAVVEDLWFTHKLLGEPRPAPWDEELFAADADWDFNSSRHDSVAAIRAIYLAACDRSRAAAAQFAALDATAALPSFGKGPASLRWIFLHLIEETAQHRGHLDLLLDAVRQNNSDSSDQREARQ